MDPVIGHYRAVGRGFELAQSVEDKAVLLGAAGRRAESRVALAEAHSLHRQLGAAWDIRHALTRMPHQH